ncbi:helix-turn-helix domain-containing protein [Streptomyces longisporoflavus]|uniref:Helix-turn-helix domain-containing protein n=1 Tax=Streptomyces longisporoflavus TaxID=28044 RepID=A0ABW7QSA1_9ACTN
MSAAWQPLPPTLPPEVRHFVEQLRLLKDRTGLSLIALGGQTAYSKSSWQRYLNAQQPPPRQAVVALCRVAGADPERFGARWELAVRAWPRGTPAEELAVVRSGAGPSGGGAFDADSAGAGLSRAGLSRAELSGDEETLPWWELPVRQPRSRRPRLRRPAAPPWRLVACSALFVVVLLLAVLLWILAR